MQNLPSPILGEASAITISTQNLDASLEFYSKLGFYEVARANFPFPWVQVSDGVLLIMLRKDANKYFALSYYVKNIENVVKKLEAKGITFITKPEKTDLLKRYIFRSPDGFNISLVGIEKAFSKTTGYSMLHMKPEDYFKPEKYANKICGMFGEIAHPVVDLKSSVEFWKTLGFKSMSEFSFPYPWAIMTDGLSIIGLHQSSHFNYPAITYFASDMTEKVANLKQNGITNFTENEPGNNVLNTPEQQHIFLFTLENSTEENTKTNCSSNKVITNVVDNTITLNPIAYIKNERTEITDDNWGNVLSEITLVDEIPEDAFSNITEFSHLEIIYYFDKVQDSDVIFAGIPRDDNKYPLMGIFAQRKKDRPNKIGICTVELIEHTGKTIIVRGLDAISNTPIIDIKPVYKEYQTAKKTKQPKWVEEMMKNYWK